MKKAASIMVLVFLAATLLSACSSNNGGGVSGSGGAAEGVTGGVVSMKGGAGNTGGNVGTWQMETYQVKGVRISSAGSADTSFSVPSYNPSVELGTNGITLSSNTTATVIAGAIADATAGTLYLYTADQQMYVSTGTGTVPDAAKIVTGLKVNAGVTLTLGLNVNTGATLSEDMASVTFTNDVDIAGTLKTADLSTAITVTTGSPDGTVRDMGGLRLETNTQMFVRSTGSINTKGTNAAATSNDNGGNGGYLYLYAGNYFVNNGTIDNSGGNGDGIGNGGNAGVSMGWGNTLAVYVNGGNDPRGIGGVFINTGSMTTNGGNGAAGGNTSQVYIDAYSNVFNTGPITSNAGTGSANIGGDGNRGIYIYSYYASIYNSGAISQKGGDGATGGGNGGYVYLDAGLWNTGDLVNSGNITTTAGSCTGSVDCNGGSAQNIDMYAYGAIKTSGNLTMNGGNGHGAGIGGNGGYLYIQNYTGYNYGRVASLPVGDIQVSGNISLNGGNGGAAGAGGSGGDFYINQASSSDAASDTGIMLLGYASADLSGGNGTATGGNAGNMYIYTYNDYPAGWSAVPPGPITNEIAITGKGGSGTGAAGLGGSGLYVYWVTDGWEYGPGGVSILTNKGNIDASGGAGGTGGGDSNQIYWYGHDGVVNSGNITMKGGDSVGVGGTGGDGAFNGIWIYSSLDIVNSGTINTTGGSGDVGGNGSLWSGTPDPFGNWVALYAGGQVANTGSIICNGGAGVATNGNGGGIELYSEKEGSVFASTSIAAGAGAGAAGTAGQVWIDGVQVK